MSKWLHTTIGDVLTLQRGIDITRAEQNSGSIPVVSSGGVKSFHDVALSEGPGVIIGRKGTLNRTYYLPGPYWPHDTTLWVKDFKGNNPRFVYYFFLNLDVSGLDVGSANPTLNRNHVHPLPVAWPPIVAQRGIAAVLGALDDKIYGNERICKAVTSLSESMFDLLVRGVEPGPETFGSTAGVFGGGTPSTAESDYWDGDIPWATPSDITALDAPYLFTTKKMITENGLGVCASRRYPAGSIFMTSRATIGAFAVNQVPAAVNQGFIVVVPPRPELRWWLFHEMRSRVDEMISVANGSTFLELSRRTFKSMAVRLPGADVCGAFFSRVDPLHRRAGAAAGESATLRKLRDVLLPKLMSGEIRVRDAEKIVEDVT
jgi:type I restriction enzyme S subunit